MVFTYCTPTPPNLTHYHHLHLPPLAHFVPPSMEEEEKVVHARCMLLLVVHSVKLVLAIAKQWLGRRWLTWRFVAGYRRGLDVGTRFVM